MKKLVFLFVAFAAISFASCGNLAANTEANVDSTATTVEEVAPVATDSASVVDSAATDSDVGAE